MKWLAALTMLLFQGLAVCTIGVMITSGLHFGAALFTAVCEVTLGVIIIRLLCRDMHQVHEID
jgi:hypothetical protein